jgi:phosphatidate cytidylyltransferase
MIQTIYIIIIAYFLLGAVAFHFINRKKTAEEARRNRIKLASYFLIINILFFSIVPEPLLFRILAAMIILTGACELFRLYTGTQPQQRPHNLFILSITLYLILSLLFFLFSGLNSGPVLFTFLTVAIFDSFSQIAGQLFGRHKLLPNISPKKTTEGLAGGILVTLATSLLIGPLTGTAPGKTLLLATGIILFSFAGDIMASYYKRRFGVKDFSRLIPGHGGVLDRFDSLIAGGAFVALADLIFKL